MKADIKIINDSQRGCISPELLKRLKNWITEYINSFSDPDVVVQENLDMKRIHTFKVGEEIRFLAKELGLKNDALRLAEIIGLFHDVGRFHQYTKYKTYKDSNSEDHAALGVKVMKENGLLDLFNVTARSIISKAIAYHNRLRIPEESNKIHLFFQKLIRNADKVDIFRVILTYFEAEDRKANAVQWNYPNTPGATAEVLDDLKHKRCVNIKHVKTKNDFRLMQMSWIYDLNFQPTRELISKRGYMLKMRKMLPATKEFDEICGDLLR